MSTTFLWGMKRSGIHHVVNWLYANHGAMAKADLATDGLHPQLHDGFCDPDAGVAFGYVMNHVVPRWQSTRNRSLIDALYASLAAA